MSLKVFLVEDSAAMREYLTGILVAEAEVDLIGIAETEVQATQWLERNQGEWDIAVVDLFLREGSGAGVVRQCRERCAGQTVLVMSNHGQLPMLHQCKLLGADAVYDKMTELDDLVAYCIGLSAQKSARLVRHQH